MTSGTSVRGQTLWAIECVDRMRELGSHSRTSGGNSSDWSRA